MGVINVTGTPEELPVTLFMRTRSCQDGASRILGSSKAILKEK